MTALSGSTVLLTGGSRGIGPLIAQALAERGARLVLTARSLEGLDQVVKNLSAAGAQAVAIPADLKSHEERQRLVAEVLERFGGLDILVNNAGIESEGAYLDLSWDAIEENISVNLLAPMALAHLLLPQMLAHKRGHIVNIASIAAKSGAPYAAAYCGAKAGLGEWTRAMRLELAGSGVRFSTIFPGYITGVGMFARFNLQPPLLVGSCTPAQVARAVVRAIEKNQVETIVNSSPLRLSFALNELAPGLGDWIVVRSGAAGFQRRKVGL